MKNNQTTIYQLAKKEMEKWPQELKRNIKKYWQKTLQDDQRGLISSLPFRLNQDYRYRSGNCSIDIHNLGLINLYFWTAANIQDDINDEVNTPKQYLCLSNSCFIAAQKIIWLTWKKNNLPIEFWQEILLKIELANFKELNYPQLIPRSDLTASHKSLFLLLSSMFLIKFWRWTQKDQDNFFLAGKYFLAAKQIADDVYDFRADWQKGRRNFAHRHLKKLPRGKLLNSYYYKQALRIMKLCHKCRQNMKKISVLEKGDCFDDYLKILENNCQKASTK